MAIISTYMDIDKRIVLYDGYLNTETLWKIILI